MSSIREELLLKAQRDTSKLVKVQRTVTRGGKTFTQNFYVKPSEVRSTDKVIGGQQNLLPAMGSVAKPAAGVLDMAYFDMLAASDKTKALDYLKSCGITWNEHTHAGINWMRAKQALAAQGTNLGTTQVNSQTQAQNTVSAQNSQPKGSSSTFDKISSVQQELNKELADCKNGREKVVVLKKKVGIDGCEYMAEQFGVTWDRNDHAAINWMRLSAALQKYFDEKDGTVSPKNVSSSAPKKNSDELPTPKDATQRKQNIIKIINSITSESDLESFISIGMLPEDDVSKAFILDKLAPKYATFAAAHLKGNSSSSSKNRSNRNNYYGFADQIAYDLNYEGCAKKVVGYGLKRLYQNFNMAILTDPRSQIATLVGDYSSRSYRVNTTFGVLTDLNNAFAFYATDDYAEDKMGVMRGQYMTSKGYTGLNPEEYAKRYDIEKEGFTRALRNIQEKFPDLESKCDEMIEYYDEIMQICGGNPNALESILSTDSWTDSSDGGRPDSYDFGSRYGTKRLKPQNAKETIRVIDLQYEALMKIFSDRGMSDKAIVKTLGNTWYNDDLNNFVILDENGNRIESIDVTVEAKFDDGSPMLSDDYSKRGSCCYLDYMCAKYVTEHGMDSYYNKTSLESYNYYKQIANISAIDYVKVQDRLHKIFGIEFTKTDLNTGKTETVDLTTVDPEVFGSELSECSSSSVFDKNKDYVLSNLMMMSMETRIHREIVDSISENPSSKLNRSGEDYSGNYSFYIPTRNMEDRDSRVKQSGSYSRWGGAGLVYDIPDLERKLNEQLSSMKTFSPEYIDHLAEFYNAKSSYQDATGEAKKATFGSVGIDVKDYVDDPLKDILYQYTTAIASNIPRMSERGVDKLNALMAKRMDYVPYDFKAPKQKRLSDSKTTSSSSSNKSNLRSLREQALRAVNCTIAVEDEVTSLQMRKDFLFNWDYRDGRTEKTPDGIAKQGRMYSGPASWGGHDRRALFNSRFFMVNNSNMEEEYDEYRADLEANHNYSTHALGQSIDYKPSDELELYHACSYAGAAGILGKTGGWFMGNQYTKTAKALGNGAYFGFKGAKSSVYCGEGSGGYHNTYASGDNANGCYILATVMRGKSGDSQSDNGRFRDYEIAVKTNKCIKPHHFVDISARCMDVNVKRDSKGNYIDPNNGQITHDRYGQSVSMK